MHHPGSRGTYLQRMYTNIYSGVSQGLIPFILSVYIYWHNRSGRKEDDNLHGPEDALRTSRNAVLDCLKYTGPPGLMSGANILASIVSSSARSTYICPVATGAIEAIPFLQWLGLILDCFILISIGNLAKRCRNGRSAKGTPVAVTMGSLFLVYYHILTVADRHILINDSLRR